MKQLVPFVLVASAWLAPSAFAQEESPLLPPQLSADPRERMKELFVQVERRLGEIDQLLYRAGSGEAPLESQAESGIGELLKQSRSSGQRVLDDIDELLKIAQQMGGSAKPSRSGQQGQQQGQGEGQGQQQGQQGQSPQQGSQRPQAQERTPEAPGQQPQPQQGQPQSQPGEEQGKGANQPQPGESKPEGDRASKDPARNSAGNAPPTSAKGQADGARSNEQWGDLPPTVRDLFRTEGGSDLPPQYRDWIDAYYRRLNQERR